MATAKEKSKPRLKNLDDLFNLNDGENPLDMAVPILDTQSFTKRAVVLVPIV